MKTIVVEIEDDLLYIFISKKKINLLQFKIIK